MSLGSPAVAAPFGALGVAVEPGDRGTWRFPDRAGGSIRLFLLTTACYTLGSLPAQFLLRESDLSAAFFIPAGVTVAFLLRLPRRHWLTVLAAVAGTEVVLDVLVGYELAAIGGFAGANVGEPLVGALIVSRMCGVVDLTRPRHVAWFVLGSMIIACAVGAAIGSFPQDLMGGPSFADTFFQWWLGDAVGVALIGGAILAFGSTPERRAPDWPLGWALVLGTGLISVAVFRRGIEVTFLLLVGIVLAGAFSGTRAVAMTGLVVAAVYALLVWLGAAPQSLIDATTLLTVKLRLAIFTLTGLIVAAMAHEGRSAVEKYSEAASRAQQEQAQGALERHIATRLQQALLPVRAPAHSEVSIAFRYEPGSEGMLVGGDWYHVFSLPGNRIGFTVGDVAGHGLEAAAAMGRLRTAVSVLAVATDSPAELLRSLDTYVRGPEGTEFATAIYAVFEPDTGKLTYAYAGHPPMLVISASGETRWLLEGRSQPLHGGAPPDRVQAVSYLEAGSLLVVYSDGLVERRGEGLQQGLQRLEAEARKLAGKSPESACELLMQELGVAEFRTDDVVLVALRYLPHRAAA
jgi:serine phosphatase RsbU (regulator of sigma subunit)